MMNADIQRTEPGIFLRLLCLLVLAVIPCAARAASDDAGTTDSLKHYFECLKDPNRNFTIVALGDSNTEVNWTSRGGLNWTGLVACGLFEGGAAKRVKMINSGISGDWAPGGLQRMDEDVLQYKPDLVMINYALNDYHLCPPEVTESSLREMIHCIREAGDSSILLRTPQPVYIDSAGDGEFITDAHLQATIAAVRRVAKSENVALVDHFAMWSAPGQRHPPRHYMYNMLHPNEVGHRRFYAELAPVLGLPKDFRWEREAIAARENGEEVTEYRLLDY
ncbi:hypothetical protein BH09SUM1_BH09SUM1_05870 [soil metagenome]